MLMSLAPLVHLVAPWHDAYSDSKVLPPVVTSVHLLSLLFGGGLAVAADRATLRTTGEPAARRGERLEELAATHRPVLIALSLLFASGVALAAADLETFVESTAFWIKLGLVAALLLNGLALTGTERSLRRAAQAGHDGAPRLWRRLRATALVSVALWAAVTVAGVALVGAA